MAGIEKICEFSGEYGSYDMYQYKRNHIQILPQFRKKFRKAKHTLYVSKGQRYVASRSGSYMSVYSKKMFDRCNMARFFDNYQNYLNDCLRHGGKFTNEYQYCLVVDDKSILGEVDGLYFNQTFDLACTKRKLKRMLRCKNLNIVYVDSDEDYGSFWNFVKDTERRNV